MVVPCKNNLTADLWLPRPNTNASLFVSSAKCVGVPLLSQIETRLKLSSYDPMPHLGAIIARAGPSSWHDMYRALGGLARARARSQATVAIQGRGTCP